jgi:hypothetical protein
MRVMFTIKLMVAINNVGDERYKVFEKLVEEAAKQLHSQSKTVEDEYPIIPPNEDRIRS